MKSVIGNGMVIESEREQDRSGLRASLWLMGLLTLITTLVLIPFAS